MSSRTVQIDASGNLPEQADECLNKHAEALFGLVLPLLCGRSDIDTELPSLLAKPQVQRRLDAIVRRCEALHAEHDECLRALSANGWFLSPDTPVEQLRVLRQSLAGASVAFSTSVIRVYFLERLDALERALLAEYPRRGHILRDAFRAHNAGQYTLSVPVFLCQADGIWRDRFSENFFLRKHRAITLEHSLKEVQLRCVASMLRALESHKTPLWASETERDLSFDALNRHQVLHGESVDYATEENSLKAISLVDCFRGLSRRVAQ